MNVIMAVFTWLGSAFGFLEDISPAITQWIEAKIPLEKQRVMDRRMRSCKRLCRRGKFDVDLIAKQVEVDFSDLPELQADIKQLLIAELK